jgi:fluoride exporter
LQTGFLPHAIVDNLAFFSESLQGNENAGLNRSIIMQAWLCVFFGGGFGSILRYATVLALRQLLPAAVFPWGILLANVLGSFALGFLAAHPALKLREGGPWLFLATGMLGGYTTFSTWTQDVWQLWLAGQTGLAALNLSVSVIGGLMAAALGWRLGEVCFG